MLLTLFPYFTALANVALTLGVLCGLTLKVRRVRRRLAKVEAEAQMEAAQLSAAANELKGRVHELEENQIPQADGPAPAGENGLSSTLRSKVLKMHRLGQSAGNIAGLLRIPKGEVDLLVKVHRIIMRPYEEAQAQPAEVVEKP
jgi:hypothetical protein